MTDGAEIKMFYDGMDVLAMKEQKKKKENKFLWRMYNDKPRNMMFYSEACPWMYFGHLAGEAGTASHLSVIVALPH